LNSQDRNQAFLKFLLFFLVTLVLAILAVYFDYRLPIRENRMLQEEAGLQRNQDENQDKFAVKMGEAVLLLDSLDKPGGNPEQVDDAISGKLTELSQLRIDDNTSYGKIDKAVVDQFYSLQRAKKQLRETMAKAAQANQYESQLNDLRTQLTQANADLDAYRRSAK